MAVSSMDFSYFSSAPVPYQFYGVQHQSTAPETEFHFDDYGNIQTNEQFDPTLSHFPDAFPFEQQVTQPPGRSSSRPFHSQTPISPSLENGAFLADELRPRSSSEEKDSVTPQQNKRKAQNRAAQRAFRERKEKHLKDLETKLADLQQQSMSLDSENERLRKELAKKVTENEALKATAVGQSLDADDLFGPVGFHLRQTKDGKQIPNTAKFSPLQTIIIDDSSGQPLLNAGQTWDYIQAHDLFKKGLVDVGDVCERLKKLARCHGQGPVFRENDIRRAIDHSAVAGGRDELI